MTSAESHESFFKQTPYDDNKYVALVFFILEHALYLMDKPIELAMQAASLDELKDTYETMEDVHFRLDESHPQWVEPRDIILSFQMYLRKAMQCKTNHAPLTVEAAASSTDLQL